MYSRSFLERDSCRTTKEEKFMLGLKAVGPLIGKNRDWVYSFCGFPVFLRSLHNNKGIGPKEDPTLNKEVTTNTTKNGIFQVKPQSLRSAPASMDPSIAKMMKQDVKPYIPKLKHQRLAYEYPGLPNEDDFVKHTDKIKKPKVISRWSLVLPKIAVFAAVIWGAYVVKVWVYASDDDAGSTDLLDPTVFHKFVVTHKYQIDADHFLMEVRPKYNNWQYSYYAHYAHKSIWNGDKMWSVEVKQPEIMVVRSYTPLPLYFMQSEVTRTGKIAPLLRVIDNDCEDYDKGGVMTFYIKRYPEGQVSRYIGEKNVGDELEIRGPHVDYKLPHHPLNELHERPIFRDLPSKVAAETLVESIKRERGVPDYDNMDFYAAGTGIAPILQVLFSRNPYRGFVNVHFSARSESELEPLKRFLFFLEKLDRIKFYTHIDSNTQLKLAIKDVHVPEEPNYTSSMRKEHLEKEVPNGSEVEKFKLRMAVLEGTEDASQSKSTTSSSTIERGTWYENALDQARATSLKPKKNAALAVVCGPEGYVEYVAGPKHVVTGEQGRVEGLLGKRGWDSTNVFKL